MRWSKPRRGCPNFSRDRGPRLVGRVRAPQADKLMVMERLHAETDPRDPDVEEPMHVRPTARFWIHLQRRLDSLGHREGRSTGIENLRDLGRVEQRWCPATEEDGVDLCPIAGSTDFGNERD